MNKFEFIAYTPTPGEKHEGIAEVRINGPVVVILRYKIVARKDGKGYFPACAGYKMPHRCEGQEYDEAFLIDSRSDNDAIIKMILTNFSAFKKHEPPSVFNSNNSNYQVPEYEAPPVTQTEPLPPYQEDLPF